MKIKKQYSINEMNTCIDIFISSENNINEYEIINIILNCSATAPKSYAIEKLLRNNFDLFSDKQFLLNTLKSNFSIFSNKADSSWYEFIYKAGFDEVQMQDAELFLLNNCYLGTEIALKKLVSYCGIDKVNYFVDYWLNSFFSDLSKVYYASNLMNCVSNYNMLEDEKIIINEKKFCEKYSNFILQHLSTGKFYTQNNNLVYMMLEHGDNVNKQECYDLLVRMFCKNKQMFDFVNTYQIPFSVFIDGIIRNYTNSDVGLNEQTKRELDSCEVAVKLMPHH